MACTACKEKPMTDAAELLYQTTQTHVIGQDGVARSLQGSLLPLGKEPVGGWGVELSVRGQRVKVSGGSARAVFSGAKRLLETNGQPATDLNLWLNLNLLWLKDSPARGLTVRESDLLLLAAPATAPVGNPERARKQVPVDSWGSRGWAMLQMYLAQDVYEYGRFLLLVDELRNWVDPSKNPTLGCADCYRHFSIEVIALKQDPRYTQDEARKWLFDTMNRVNVRKGLAPLTFDVAKKLNFWT